MKAALEMGISFLKKYTSTILIAVTLRWSAIWVGLMATSIASAQPLVGVMPVCSTASYTAQEVNNYLFQPMPHLIGETLFADKSYVSLGLKYDCVSQMRLTTEYVCPSPGSCLHELTGMTLITTGSAFPNTVNGSGGDGQRVSITAPGLERILWGSCFPATQSSPGKCSPSVFTENNFPGHLYYRFREMSSGNFVGPWTVSLGGNNPGFRIQRAESCPIESPACVYEVIFNRNSAGLTLQKQDVQAVLQFNVSQPSQRWSATIGVPMLFIQQDIALPDPDPSGPSAGTCKLSVAKNKSTVSFSIKTSAGSGVKNISVSFSAKLKKATAFKKFGKAVKTSSKGQATISLPSKYSAKGVTLKGVSAACMTEATIK